MQPESLLLLSSTAFRSPMLLLVLLAQLLMLLPLLLPLPPLLLLPALLPLLPALQHPVTFRPQTRAAAFHVRWPPAMHYSRGRRLAVAAPSPTPRRIGPISNRTGTASTSHEN